ncbi:MAG: 50S ribosomal protein L17 [Candidatus Buchananbacteria bacterium]|jgi:large subunit ribosomal protein L17
MRHNRKGKVLGRTKAPREALMRSLVTSFIVYEKIKTTTAKAKALRPLAEKYITLGKTDTLHNRRQALKFLYTDGAVKKLFEVVGPRYKERKGGYTRIIKLAPRQNDGAEVAIIEMVK